MNLYGYEIQEKKRSNLWFMGHQIDVVEAKEVAY